MSSALAVAGVTAVLRGMLEAWLVQQNANAALGGANAEVTAVAPDTITLGAGAAPRLNLFLHQASPNAGWRNVDLPSHDARGHPTSSPPLALDLHYLLTAYGPEELQAEVLLGYGMQLLHEVPMIDREEIESRLPATLQSSQLGRQVEMIKVTPQTMGTDELSKLWTALQAHYRPTAAYHVSVVLIESTAGGGAALPVLSRGPIDPATNRERGVVANPNLTLGLPTISAVRPPNSQPGGVIGDTVTVDGDSLNGTTRAVRIEDPQLGVEREIAALAGDGSMSVRFTIPSVPTQLPVGTYALRVLVRRPGESFRRESNRLALTIVPAITTAMPVNVARDAQGTAVVNLSVRPHVRPYQRASLIVAGIEVLAEPHPTSTAALTFTIPDSPVGSHLARVRVDGVDSLIVDRSVTPPVFLPRRIVIA